MSNDTQPEIRFPGFTEAWELCKLGEVSEIRTGPFGSTLHAEDYVKDGFPIITTEHFKNGELPESKDNVPQVSAEDYNRLKSYTLNEEDIVFSRVGSVDLNALVSKAQSRWLFSGRVLRVRSNNRINSQYLHYELSTTRAKNDVISRAVGQTMPSINTEILKSTSIYFPKFTDEQYKIGVFFKKLDDTITLHQRKLDLLKETKKGFLQKMFPENGAKVPEIRFPGFTGDWEQRKLGELTKIKTGSSDLQDADAKGIYPFFVRSEIIERSNRYIFDGEAILIPGEGRLGEIYHYINGKFDFHQRVYKISDFQYSDTDGKYILYYMQKYFKKHAMKYTVKATVDSLRLPMLTEFDIKIPSLDEQRAISSFFSNLDQAITLHQRKLDLLKETKKGFLQKMFV